MSLKTVLITGSTDGIGKQTALELAQLGFEVILHGRNPDRGAAVLSELRSSIPGTHFEYLNADLSEPAQIQRLAGQVSELAPRLDVLVHNAGIAMKEREITPAGLELTFAVNHLAPFLLTHLLLDVLENAGSARVITVTSSAHSTGKIEFDNLQGERHFDGWQAYCDTKLMNVLFAYELAARLTASGSRVTSNCLHPGVIATKLLKSSFPSLQGASLAEGAETSVYLATSLEVEAVSGKYFRKQRLAESSALAHDTGLRARLWEVSLGLAGLGN